jgi:hypothetical protein
MSLGTVFSNGVTQLHTFATYALSCQTPFCQTAPLLSSVAQQQNLMEYCWEGSTSTASDIMGQHNKIGGINFRVTLILFEPLSRQGYRKLVTVHSKEI